MSRTACLAAGAAAAVFVSAARSSRSNNVLLAEGHLSGHAVDDPGFASDAEASVSAARRPRSTFPGRPEDWRRPVDDMFNDQNLTRGAEFGAHLQLQPPPKNTALSMGMAIASDQLPEQHGVHFQCNTTVHGHSLIGTANPSVGEYRAIWTKEVLPNLRVNATGTVTDDGQHDQSTLTVHYLPTTADFSAMAKGKLSVSQPTALELHYLQSMNQHLALGASLNHVKKQETKTNIFGRYVQRSKTDLEPVGGQKRWLMQEDCYYAALPWPVLELHYMRRWRSPSPAQFPGHEFAFATELRMHVPNREAVAKAAVSTTGQTFRLQAAVDSKQRVTAQLMASFSEQVQVKFAVELNHAENTSQLGFNMDFPIF